MTERTVWKRVAVGALTTVSAGGALLGLAGTASASPVPGVPFTTAALCTDNGGEVVAAGPVQRCHGGGDTGDVIVSEEQARQLQSVVPKPPVGSPSLPG